MLKKNLDFFSYTYKYTIKPFYSVVEYLFYELIQYSNRIE